MTNEGQLEEFTYRNVGGKRVASVFHRGRTDARGVVVFAHGFKSSKIGPSRYFVEVARDLASRGVSAFRFDQLGSGDSEGAFEDSSFATWIDTIEDFVNVFHAQRYQVALLGQSMGGTAAVAAAARLGNRLRGLALWSAGTLVKWDPSWDGEWVEEEGQRVRAAFWRGAARLDVLDLYQRLTCPVYMVFGTADELIPVDEIRRVQMVLKDRAEINIIEGLPHSAWPEPPRSAILRETADRLEDWLGEPAHQRGLTP